MPKQTPMPNTNRASAARRNNRGEWKMTEKPKLDHSSWPEHIRRNIREGYKAPDLAQKARFEVDNLLRFTAATNPALSPGWCSSPSCRCPTRAELDRIQAWGTWDDPILPEFPNGDVAKEKLT
jgi:hypothetical protein